LRRWFILVGGTILSVVAGIGVGVALSFALAPAIAALAGGFVAFAFVYFVWLKGDTLHEKRMPAIYEALRLDAEREQGLANRQLRERVFTRDRYQCCYCGSGEILHVDHIHSFARGGRTELENLQTLCARCNIAKGTLDDADARRLLGVEPV
jgi:hypothetical protein